MIAAKSPNTEIRNNYCTGHLAYHEIIFILNIQANIMTFFPLFSICDCTALYCTTLMTPMNP